ncbi:MAG TPA: hypothetical protein VGJ44_20195, partial [Kribbellaceae bacterium]
MSEPLSTPPVGPAAAPAGVAAGPAVPADRRDGFVASGAVVAGPVGSAGAAGAAAGRCGVVAELTAWVERLASLPDAVDD